MEKDQHFFQILPISQILREQIFPLMPACLSQHRGSDYKKQEDREGNTSEPFQEIWTEEAAAAALLK